MDTEYRKIETNNKKRWTPFFRQILITLVIWTSYINTGLNFGLPTVAIPQLRKEANSTAAVSNEIASWITSIAGYTGAICIFITIPLAHFIGRKFTMAILSVDTLINSIIIYFSKTAMHLLISQAVLSLTCAAQCSVYLLILSEYSSPRYRGVFLTIKTATLYWGIWIGNAIGIFTHYKYIGLLGIFFSGCSLIISLFIIPESPYWLAFRGRYDECAVAHRWLKGVDEDAESELDVLIKSQNGSVKNMDSVKSLKNDLKNYLKAVKQPDIFKPILLCCLVTSIYVFSGKLVCAVYAIEMMKKITGNQSTVYIGVLVLDGFTVLGMYVGCGLSKIFKRRPMMLTTSITGTTLLFVMSLYLYLIKLSVLPENDYVILTLLVGYSLAVCCGPVILTTCISAELLPIRFRSICALIYSEFYLLIVSTAIKVSPYVFSSVGIHGAYLVFGICSTIAITLTYKYVPETKDKTLHEIAETFKPKDQTPSKLLDT